MGVPPASDWHDQWEVIFCFLRLHKVFPDRFPLPEKFWGRSDAWQRLSGPHRLKRMLQFGIFPKRHDIETFLHCGPAELEQWVQRRFKFVEEQLQRLSIQPKEHGPTSLSGTGRRKPTALRPRHRQMAR